MHPEPDSQRPNRQPLAFMNTADLFVQLHLRPLRHGHTTAATGTPIADPSNERPGGAKSDEHYNSKWGQIRRAHPVDHPHRAVITKETAKIPKRTLGYMRRQEFEIVFDVDQEQVLHACATGRVTWITPQLISTYLQVKDLGFLTTVGAYRDGSLVGGLWGIAIGRCVGIMSMFHTENRADQIALATLVDRLIMSDKLKMIRRRQAEGELCSVPSS